MKKAKDMLQSMIDKPIRNLRAQSSKTYERYNDLLSSIKRLAKPVKKNNRERG